MLVPSAAFGRRICDRVQQRSNLAPSNPALATASTTPMLQVPGQGPVPLALLTTSGSGLDPHLPPAAIAYQLARGGSAQRAGVDAERC
jgi:K+-transporting ATPase ATPase C chain